LEFGAWNLEFPRKAWWRWRESNPRLECVIVAFYKAYPFWGLKNEVEKGKIPTLKAFGNFRQKVKSELFTRPQWLTPAHLY